MIIDTLANASTYFGLGDKIKIALEYLINTDLKTINTGKYILVENSITAGINEYSTKAMSECRLEAHKQYIDVQFMIRGNELIGYAPLGDQRVAEAYDEGKDVAFFWGDGSLIDFNEGMFAIFYPNDLHAPGIRVDMPKEVKKIVIKVSV